MILKTFIVKKRLDNDFNLCYNTTSRMLQVDDIVSIPSGGVAVVVFSDKEHTTCKYLVSPETFILSTSSLRFLAKMKNAKRFMPNYPNLISARNELAIKLAVKTRTKELSLHELILITPPEELQTLLKERGLL